MRDERASARFLSACGWRSGWARACSWRNSFLRAERSMAKGPFGGGPDGKELGKKA